MKKLFLSLFCSAAVFSASAINYRQAREYAYFLTDKMAYELNLTTEQYEKAYQVNLDYLLSVDHRTQIGGNYWNYRDTDLRFILFDWQYNLYRSIEYFYRPAVWDHSGFSISIYHHYGKTSFYYDRPTIFYNYAGTHWSNRSYATESPYCGQVFDGRRGGMRGSYAPHVSYKNAYGYTNGYDRPRYGAEYSNGNGYSHYNYQRYNNGASSYRYGNHSSSYESIGEYRHGVEQNLDHLGGRNAQHRDNRDRNLPSRYNNHTQGTVYGETWVDNNLHPQKHRNNTQSKYSNNNRYTPSRSKSNSNNHSSVYTSDYGNNRNNNTQKATTVIMSGRR